MSTPRGSILTPDGWVSGTVEFAGARIAAVIGKAAPAEPPYVLPGFIDLHVHGADGADCMGGAEAVRRMLRYHAARGTVAMAPTTMTAPADAVAAALADIASVRRARRGDEPLVLGAHLEGPFINPNKLGAQADVALAGDPALAEAWAALCPLVVATVAPEISRGLDVVRVLAGHGCRVQVGHSLASEAELSAAFACGCCGFTHLFNAMSGLQHRAPGVVGYAFAHADYAEIICDLGHVDATAILAARRAIPRLYAITDASTATGLPDGEHLFAGRRVVKTGQRITLEDGVTLAGSAITLADALRNLVAIGVPLAEASAMTSTRQADYLGRADLGRIVPGGRAGLVRLDGDLRVTGVWVDGERLDAIA
jgi:N-acetylglucosamine-6-phosphate deacetylase